MTTRTAAKKTAPGTSFGKETYLRWFKDMLLMRRFEEKTGQLYTMQKFGGFCHLYIGQEAILAGMVTAIRPSDRVITGYRDHAHPLVLGRPPRT
jgi:pyruvate dehydrogenase E1 component alpha subunit